MRAGASFASVFGGRIDDAGLNKMEVVRQTHSVFDNCRIDCLVFAAGVRHDMLLAGADIITLPLGALKTMSGSPFPNAGLERFLADWATSRAASCRALRHTSMGQIVQ
ncbi:MAG: hypothetical protein MUQ10_20025 [Anaerolineae bacterium]|nr:hypothetical protein [Anaerolineae bacterium]